MKSYIIGGSYSIHIDREIFDMGRKPLKSPLQDRDGAEVGKQFYLSMNSDNSITEMVYTPEDSGWDDLKEIHLKLGYNDYRNLLHNRVYHHRAPASINVQISLEHSLEDFI